MTFKIIYILAVALEFVCVPLFLKYQWTDDRAKAMAYKIVCSALFITSAVMCVLISGNKTEYAKMMVIGLIFGMIGDIILRIVTDKMVIYGLGLLSFLVGHIFFIAGFAKTMHYYLPRERLFDYRVIIAVLVIFFSFALVAVFKEMKFGIAAIPVALYALVISMMLAAAVHLFLGIYINGIDFNYDMSIVGVFFTTVIGALLFVFSDASLAVLLFGGKEKNKPLKVFNIVTYFAGQILLGTSILFLHS